MKKFNIFALMLAMVVSMVGFSSCSKDEDGAPSYNTAIPYNGELVGTWEAEGDYKETLTIYSNGTFDMYNDYGDGEWDRYQGTFIVLKKTTVTLTTKDHSWKMIKDEYYDEKEDGPLSGSERLSAEEQLEATELCSYEVNEDGDLELTFYYDDELVGGVGDIDDYEFSHTTTYTKK